MEEKKIESSAFIIRVFIAGTILCFCVAIIAQYYVCAGTWFVLITSLK